jgi:hypothetical protein
VVFFAGDVLIGARAMLPEVELGDKEILGLIYRRIELDPLTGLCLSLDTHISLYSFSTCLLIGRLAYSMRLEAMPEFTSQLMTASTLDWAGEKTQ